jgi:hypothetical protein
MTGWGVAAAAMLVAIAPARTLDGQPAMYDRCQLLRTPGKFRGWVFGTISATG